MKVIADSSPLIALSKIDHFALLEKLFGAFAITVQVHAEVEVKGAGLPGAKETDGAPWIDVKRLKNEADLTAAQVRHGIELGELSTLLLAREIEADLVLVDDLKARKLMRAEGFQVLATIGILEAAFVRTHLSDLRQGIRAPFSRRRLPRRQIYRFETQCLRVSSLISEVRCFRGPNLNKQEPAHPIPASNGC